MRSAYLIRVPEGSPLDALPPEVRATWPEVPMQGMQADAGYEIRLILAAVNLAELEQAIAILALDWTVLVGQRPMPEGPPAVARRLNPSAILRYLRPVPTQRDSEGNPTQTRPVTGNDLRNGNVALHRYAGHPPWTLTPG